MSQPPAAPALDVTHRLVPSPAGRIHLVEQGTGPLVLLVHGFPESWYSWRHQLPVLAAPLAAAERLVVPVPRTARALGQDQVRAVPGAAAGPGPLRTAPGSVTPAARSAPAATETACCRADRSPSGAPALPVAPVTGAPRPG